jgi:hypothetical protein
MQENRRIDLHFLLPDRHLFMQEKRRKGPHPLPLSLRERRV